MPQCQYILTLISMQVSLYGHSLGSVLSYDILCHQESLSSSFPVDWVYKEQVNEEKSFPDIGKQCFESSFASNLPDKNIIVNNESKGIEDLVDKDDISIQSKFSLVEEHSKYSSVHTVLPVSSDSDEHSPLPNSASSSNQDVGKPNFDKNSIRSYERDGLNKTNTTNSGNLIGESNSITEEVSGETEVKSIDALKEEVI